MTDKQTLRRRFAAARKALAPEIRQAAIDLGLTADPQVNPKWLTHGYLTLIRTNWQLLPYEQILKLLSWPPEKLAYTLKEEDFFWAKVGKIKVRE